MKYLAIGYREGMSKLGAGSLQRSTLRMKLNRGEVLNAADEFPKWRIAGYRIVAGLVRGKATEEALFLFKFLVVESMAKLT